MTKKAKAAAKPPAVATEKPAAKKQDKPPKLTAIRMLAGKTLRVGGPAGPVYGQPGDVVQVPAECDADRAKALLEAGFAEPV